MSFKKHPMNIHRGAAQPSKVLSLVSTPVNLSQSVQKVLPRDLIEQPELYRLVHEYCELAYKPALTQLDIERVSEIYGLAEYDGDLNFWIDKIDNSIDPLFVAIRQKERISLQDFIAEMNSVNSRELTIDKFKGLTQKLHFTDCFLSKYICFQKKEYSRQLICQTSNCAIFTICWKPNQLSQAHLHTNDLTVIRVYDGTLTYTDFDEVNEIYFHEGLEGKQLKYVKKEECKIEKGSWLSIENGKVHQLGNKSSTDLVTIHFRYFKRPILREDRE
jgi:predicted metal-dependent enzyme (double-stranded beta helix superfamily)